MELLQREMSFESCADDERIFVRIVEPVDREDVKAVLQIAHGMAEHSLLYMDFARYMASKGFAVAVNDHLGHGKSVSKGGSYGYFGEGGYQNLLTDMHKLHDIMHRDYPYVPYLLLGHSMGSFLSRAYSVLYPNDLSGVAYLGTCGSQRKSMLAGQRTFAEARIKKLGPKAHDAIFAKLSTGRFNQAFAPNRTANDWLSRDEAEVDRYTNDPLCGFDLTISGYRDILDLQALIGTAKWFRAVPHIPILLMAGEQDPVGNNGKGVRQVAHRLVKTGHDVHLVLYPEARHVVLCESNKQQVYEDICGFMEAAIRQTKAEENAS